MEKKKGFPILKVFIIIICILFIIISLAVNIAFADGKIPHILGRYIYIAGQDADMGDFIKEDAALIAKDASDLTISTDDIVLCYPSSSPDKLSLRFIGDTTGGNYKTYTASKVDENTITKDSILAKCTGYPQSAELGKFINFTKGIKGIVAELILPCVILVIFLIAKIASSKTTDDEDENYDFYEYDEEAKENGARRSHAKTGSPLFEASQEIQPSNELERKKMSIAENFSQKKVNHDSPYQKEKERTMQFKTQRSAESQFAARNMGGQSSTAPTADALREEVLRKNAEKERTGQFSVSSAAEDAPTVHVSDNTGVLSKAQLAEMSGSDVPRTTPLRSQSAPSAAKKSSTPDITDILRKTESGSKKKPVSDMSVDDLLQIIENEKNKL